VAVAVAGAVLQLGVSSQPEGDDVVVVVVNDARR